MLRRFELRKARRVLQLAALLVLQLLALLGIATLMPAAASAADSPTVGGPVLAVPGVGVLPGPVPSLLAAGLPAGAAKAFGTVDWTRTSSYDEGNWADPDPVFYYADASARLGIVSYKSATSSLAIDTYDTATLQRVGETRSVSLAGWPRWGGFYAGSDGTFYVLVGRENPSENDALNVVAVRRYNADWTLLGTAYIQGGATHGVKGIYSPLRYSSASMVLVGQRLIVHMGRLIYANEGVHHQVNLTFEVDVDSMKATTFGQLGGIAYSSHSFRQLVTYGMGGLVMIDHGDAYPRSIQMGVMSGYPSERQVVTSDLFEFNGAVGNNFTGATVTGLINGRSGIVVVGNSIRHPNAPNGALGSPDERRNVYTIAIDPISGEHTLRWLTSFAPEGADDALEPRVVQVGSDHYAVLFSVRTSSGSYRMEYHLINSSGIELLSTAFPGVFFCSVSEPVLVGTRVYWVGIKPDSSVSPAPAYLYGMNVSNSTSPSLIDATPPTTTLTGLPSTWSRAPVTLVLNATDTAGVASTEYRVGSGDWTSGTSLTIAAPADHSNDGVHTVSYRSSDLAGNVEATKTATVKIDTLGPATYAASTTRSTYRYRTVKLPYKIADARSTKATAIRIVVRNSAGKAVKSFYPTSRATATWYSVSWTPSARGTYRYYVYAKDLAGNAQLRVGSVRVVVK